MGEPDRRNDRVGDGHSSRVADRGGEGGGERVKVRNPEGLSGSPVGQLNVSRSFKGVGDMLCCSFHSSNESGGESGRESLWATKPVSRGGIKSAVKIVVESLCCVRALDNLRIEREKADIVPRRRL